MGKITAKNNNRIQSPKRVSLNVVCFIFLMWLGHVFKMRMNALKPVWFIVLLQTLLKATCQACSEEPLNGLTWPESGAGLNVSVACSPDEPGKAIRACGADDAWGPVNYTGCTLQTLVDLYNRTKNASSIVAGDLAAVASELATKTKDSVRYSGQLVTAADTLLVLFAKDGLSELSTEDTDMYITNILNSADNLLDSSTFGSLWENIHTFKDGEFFLEFLKGFEDFGEVVTFYLNRTGQASLTITTTRNFQSTYEVVHSDENVIHEFADHSTKVTIPKSALTNTDSSRNASVATLVFKYAVRNLFPPQTKGSRIGIDADNISSVLVSCSIFPTPQTDFVDSVSIQMKNDRALPNSTCSFLKFSDPNSVWIEDLEGCKKPVFNEDGTTVTCHCTHLTTFAVIGKYNTRGQLPNTLLASIVLYLVLIATTFCLLLYANRKFDSDRASIVLCFLATLFTGHVTLVSGLYAIDNKDACRAVALLLHYFQLSYSFWMLAQAVQLVLKVTYKTTETGSVSQFLALGWITPLFVVAGTAGLYVEHYGRGNYCALPFREGVSFAIIVPVALIGCTNYVCLFYAFYCFHCLKKTDKKCLVHMNRILPNIRACLIVLPLEICEWIFASLSSEFEYTSFDVLWALSALAMSILILLFYGIGSTEVIEEYEAHFGPCCWQHKKSSAVRDSPRPGWRDEISQISQYREASSIMRDMDSAATATGNGTSTVAGCSGINNGGLEVDDVLAHGRELNDVSKTNHLASSLSSSFMLKTKLKVFPIRKSQQQGQSSAAKQSRDNHR